MQFYVIIVQILWPRLGFYNSCCTPRLQINEDVNDRQEQQKRDEENTWKISSDREELELSKNKEMLLIASDICQCEKNTLELFSVRLQHRWRHELSAQQLTQGTEKKRKNWHDSVRKIPFEFHIIIMTPQCQYVEQCIVTVSITSALQAEMQLFCLGTKPFISAYGPAHTASLQWHQNVIEMEIAVNYAEAAMSTLFYNAGRGERFASTSVQAGKQTTVRFFWHPHPRRFRCDQFMLKIPA